MARRVRPQVRIRRSRDISALAPSVLASTFPEAYEAGYKKGMLDGKVKGVPESVREVIRNEGALAAYYDILFVVEERGQAMSERCVRTSTARNRASEEHAEARGALEAYKSMYRIARMAVASLDPSVEVNYADQLLDQIE